MYAIVYKHTVNIPGDERSRTNPGHGYPAHTESYAVFKKFNTREELDAWILRNPDEEFDVYKVSLLKMEKKVEIILSHENN